MVAYHYNMIHYQTLQVSWEEGRFMSRSDLGYSR